MEKNYFKRFWLVVLHSFALNLIVTPSLAAGEIHCEWVYAVSFFALTWYCLAKYHKEGESKVGLIMALIFGKVILEIPIRIIDYIGSIGSLIIPFITIVSIILATICYIEKKAWVFALSIIIIIFFIIFIGDAWQTFVHSRYL